MTVAQVPAGMATIIVEIGFTTDPPTSGNYFYLDDSARGKLTWFAGGTQLAPTGLMSDVSDDVRSFTTRRGSSRADPIVRWEAGTSQTVLKDLNRDYDPTNLSGPYVSGGVTQVEPMRVVRHRAAWNGVTYNISQTYADSYAISYAQRGNYAEVVVNATDGFKALQLARRTAVASVGNGELTGARVTRILDSAGWNASDRVISAGDSAVSGTILDGDALAELLLVTDTEQGELYVDARGRLFFRNRQAILKDARSTTSQATFGDGPGELAYSEIIGEYDEQQLVNQVRIGRVGGVVQQADDAASQTKYLLHAYERTDPIMTTDAAAKDAAHFLLYKEKGAELRMTGMVFYPRRDPDNLYPQALGREIGDRITINLRPDAGDPISRELIIRGIAHDVTRSQWKTTFILEAASKFNDFMLLNDATRGKLGTAVLAF